jgi:hypothetical protein
MAIHTTDAAASATNQRWPFTRLGKRSWGTQKSPWSSSAQAFSSVQGVFIFFSPSVRFVTVLRISAAGHPVSMRITYHAGHGKVVSQITSAITFHIVPDAAISPRKNRIESARQAIQRNPCIPGGNVGSRRWRSSSIIVCRRSNERRRSYVSVPEGYPYRRRTVGNAFSTNAQRSRSS